MPGNAGVQRRLESRRRWIPAFRGRTMKPEAQSFKLEAGKAETYCAESGSGRPNLSLPPRMNSKDGWFLGILALAYLYLDLIPTSVSEVDRGRGLTPPGDRDRKPGHRPSVERVPSTACPRQDLHLVTIREDGAIWCHPCDEAFYPSGAMWQSLLATSAR